jgi:hypothetical protein
MASAGNEGAGIQPDSVQFREIKCGDSATGFNELLEGSSIGRKWNFCTGR